MERIVFHFQKTPTKILLSNFEDSAAIAIYSIGLQFSQIFITFAGAISSVMVPEVYRLVQEGRNSELSALWLKVGRYQFYIVFFVIFLFNI